MNKKITKFLLVFFTFAVVGVFCVAQASDYKYKILDPKYNSSIENYEYDEMNSTLAEKEEDTNNHPLRKKAWVLVFIGFSGLFLYRIVRVLKKADCADDDEEFHFVREVFAVDRLKEVNRNIKSTASYMRDKLDVVKHPTDIEKMNKRLDEIKIHDVQKTTNTTNVIKSDKPAREQKSLDRFVNATMQKMKNPFLLSSSKLANNKGLCLVEFNGEYSLIGYIDDEIFILDKFNSLNSNEIRSRLSESIEDKDRYIVKLGNYKALVEVSDKNMELLLEL